jgi:hypothetical protein
VIATAEARRKAAEVAQRFTGWTVWVTPQANPVATRLGGQRASEPDDGNWAQMIVTDDWDELEAELTAQMKYGKGPTNQATHGITVPNGRH